MHIDLQWTIHGMTKSQKALQSNLPLRPPLVSDHLSLATTFSKYQTFSSQITTDGTSRRRPPLVSDHF